MKLRPAQNQDAAAIVEVVDLCYREYPPYQLFVEDEPALLTPEDSFDRFWVLEDDQGLIGTIAGEDHGADASPRFELKKLYLHPRVWGGGGATLLEQAFVAWAETLGGGLAELWSDVLFTRAHRFYAKCGWTQTQETRQLADSNGPFKEFRFHRTIRRHV